MSQDPRATCDPRRALPPARPTAAAELCGLVVCGGESARMGSDKARLELGGRSLLERTVATLGAVAPRVVLACGSQARYGELGLELVLDARATSEGDTSARTGPIAGLLAALESIDAERFVVLPCDMPRAGEPLLRALIERSRRDELDACLFESSRGLEPLCAVYHRRCAPAMRAALAAGERRVVAFLDHETAEGASLRIGRVREGELDPRSTHEDPASNLNTPEDYARERASWKAVGR